MTKPDAVEDLLRSTARKPEDRPRTSADAPAARVDDHYGAGIVDAGAALARARVKGAGGLGLGAALGLLGLAGLRRRGQLAGARLVGAGRRWSSGPAACSSCPSCVSLPSALAFLGVGHHRGGARRPSAGWARQPAAPQRGAAPGGRSPCWRGPAGCGRRSAGSPSAWPARWPCWPSPGRSTCGSCPTLLDRAWLVLNAAACVLLGRAVLRR